MSAIDESNFQTLKPQNLRMAGEILPPFFMIKSIGGHKMTHEEETCGTEGGCRSGEGSCGCEGQCDCQSNDSCCSQQSMLGGLIYLAKEAKYELLKEKIKRKLESSMGKKLDQMADVAVEAFLESWKGKKEMKSRWQELEEKLEKIFESQ
jgi:hypothetical protein